MGKRMTATEKWDKAWFRKLSPRHKSLWQFLCDKCDQSGMWEIDFDNASHYVNDEKPITEADLKSFGPRLEKFGPDKLWIVSFCDFQYEHLSEKCPAHKPVFKLLKKYNLLNRVLNRVSNTLQEKEEEIEKEKDKELEEEKEKDSVDVFGDKGEWSVTVRKVYANDNPKRIYDLKLYFEQAGKLKEFEKAHFVCFDEFMQANPANEFKDDNHLYNTFRKFHIDKQLLAAASKKTMRPRLTLDEIDG